MNTVSRSSSLTLVLGGTGKTGSRIVKQLKAKGVPVRVGSRDEVPSFDWEDRSSWADALHNVRAVYVSFFPDLAVEGASSSIRLFCQLALESGVQRLVLLSGRGEEEAGVCENIVKAAGIPWTILRSSWFSQNFSEGFLRDMVLAGCIALPVGEVREPFIDVEDIADVAVAALTEGGHVGKLYELTGPRSLTFAEATNEVAAHINHSLHYKQLTQQAFTSVLSEQNVPADTADLLAYLFSSVLDGRNEQVADGVQRALGRPARDFSDYVKRVAVNGAWEIAGTQ